MLDSIFNGIIYTLIRDVPMSIRRTIAVFLFLGALTFFNLSFRKKNDIHPIKIGFFVLFIICLIFSVLYLSL